MLFKKPVRPRNHLMPLMGILKELLSSSTFDVWDNVNVEVINLAEYSKPVIRITGEFYTVEDYIDESWEKNR